jgi:anti-sigma regulatory factor (Ser/Thr protein kinase)
VNGLDQPVSDRVRAYEGLTTSVRQVRADVTDWLRTRGDDEDTVERAVLIASELATNAVHAAPGMRYTVSLRSIDPHTVELTVSNPSVTAVLPPRESWVPPDVLARQGRGLSIVAALSAIVSADVEADQVSVTALIRTTPQR